MKIIGGRNKGRKIKVSKRGIRPTKGIIRGAIFNIIAQRLQNAHVLDIFAGSGALGLEAVSRGAQNCVFIEKKPNMLLQNIKNFSLVNKTKVIAADFRSGLKRMSNTQFDIIFVDPPYNKKYIEITLTLIDKRKLLKRGGIIVAEHSVREEFTLPDALCFIKKKHYRDTVVSFITENGIKDMM
ncbi:MAG: 16S rRNA (guanine(966)-N(2))-methyltransferase RsmD [candidate division WOR-3 bacterium]|nr:MAG: 16S rRNA (guanine(966)-N(2))-methyltransferase RsmD [candidate division WOR-3 bacterium]